jgi:hypothetical protein
MKLADINALRSMTFAQLTSEAIAAGVDQQEAFELPTKDALRLAIITAVAEREHADDVAFGAWASNREAENREAMKIDFAGKRLIDNHNGREIRPYKRTLAHEEGGTGAWFCSEYQDGVLVDDYTTSALYLRDHTRELSPVSA